MAIDVEALLARVVAEIFDENVSIVLEDAAAKRPQTYCAHLHSAAQDRRAHLCATYEWFELRIPDLDVSVTLFDYDDDDAPKDDALRELGLVARAYLDGEGCIESRRRFLRRGTSQRLTLDVNDRQWQFGKHASSVPYP
ncbi:hypothetical protein [Ornithinimicrobium pratense]|uniref:Uncharacterized protein n=1 Tax=Ornithinimicrobium pratense TaxID=2593973 RepID=A0A5J6V5E1_9MICO|nr:hypothetical protein [Ornithinimicrobium pratense]QFG68406.1 hypothetical protein FY030_06480 [Ornithinimicrobium pratense]